MRVRYSPKWRERSFWKGSDLTGWFRVASAHSSQSGILIVIGRGKRVVQAWVTILGSLRHTAAKVLF